MEEWQQLVDDCMARESRLSTWEREFIDSIAKQLADGQPLTQAQADKLEEIWEAATAKG